MWLVISISNDFLDGKVLALVSILLRWVLTYFLPDVFAFSIAERILIRACCFGVSNIVSVL